MRGYLSWLLWGLVHIYLLIGFRNRLAVFVNWMWSWITYGRGARLITGPVSFGAIKPIEKRPIFTKQPVGHRAPMAVSPGN